MPKRPKKKNGSGSKEELDLYVRCDEEGSRRIYLQKLSDFREAIIRGNVNGLKNVCQCLLKIHCIEKEENLRKYYEHPGNPFLGTNVIIFTCRLNQYSVLKYLVLSEEGVLFKLYEKIGLEFIHPANVGDHKHTAFYYAILSNDTNIIEGLAEYWPGYDSQNGEKLEGLLSKSYEELRLKNVDISPEMGIHVEKRLLDLRFFCKTPQSGFWQRISMRDIIARYDLLIEKIDEILNFEHSPDDMVFSYKVKFIAQNIHVLKRFLKSTLDSIPWEEVEFCVVAYLHAKHTDEPLNIIYESIITTRRLVMHLQNFTKCLEAHRNQVLSKTVIDIQIMPAIKRNDAVKKVIDQYPFFQELYVDYERHSLIGCDKKIR